MGRWHLRAVALALGMYLLLAGALALHGWQYRRKGTLVAGGLLAAAPAVLSGILMTGYAIAEVSFWWKRGRYPTAAQRELHRAIRTGDLDAVRGILRPQPGLNGRDPLRNQLHS